MRKGRSPFLAPGPFLCLLLFACSEPTTPSSEESRQLDDAEAMLNGAPAELSNVEAGELDQMERNAP